MARIGLLMVMVTALMASFCASSRTERSESSLPKDYRAFAGLLEAIVLVAENVSDDGDWPYFKNSEVRSLYRKSRDTTKLTIQLIEDDSVRPEVKRLAIQLQQCLSLSEYLALVETTYRLLRTNSVTSDVLETMIYPSPEWGTLLGINYKDESVKALLARIETDPAASEALRETTRRLLAGEVASYVDAYQSLESPLPRLSCGEEQ